MVAMLEAAGRVDTPGATPASSPHVAGVRRRSGDFERKSNAARGERLAVVAELVVSRAPAGSSDRSGSAGDVRPSM